MSAATPSPLEQRTTATAILAQLTVERAAVTDVAAWREMLEREVVRFFSALGLASETAQADLAQLLAQEADPVAFLEALVAEQRTMQALGLEGEVVKALAESEPDTSGAPADSE